MPGFLWLAAIGLSPTETLYFRLGVPMGSRRMQRLQKTVETSWKDTAVFEEPALLDRRVAVLEAEVGAHAARLMLLRSPLLLTSDLETTVPERIADLVDTIQSGMYLLSRSPRREVLDQLFIEREKAWQELQKELIRRHGQ